MLITDHLTMFYEGQCLQILYKSSDVKSLTYTSKIKCKKNEMKNPLISRFSKNIFCVVFPFAKINSKKTEPKSQSQNKPA